MVYLKLLFLIIVANGLPIIVRQLLQNRWYKPIDLGALFLDGHPILGVSKTYRGVVCSMIGTPVAALVVGLSWDIGLIVSAWAMAGDCLSSFVKRRLKLPSGAMALGLDQIPESLLPLLGVWHRFSLTLEGIGTTVIGFIVLELVLSLILYKLHIRTHPY